MRVLREWSSRQAAPVHRWVGYACIATERSPALQKSIQTEQAHHLQNQHRNQTRVHFIVFFFFTLQKTAAQDREARREQEGLSWSMHLIDIRARPESWAIFVAKDFDFEDGLANKQAF